MDTSPVGVAVFDAQTGTLVSFNRETARILDSLRMGDRPVDQLLELLNHPASRRERGVPSRYHFGPGAQHRGNGKG